MRHSGNEVGKELITQRNAFNEVENLMMMTVHSEWLFPFFCACLF